MFARNTITMWSLLAAIAAGLVPTASPAVDLELKRVMLSAGGVGYFEHEARVDGDAVLTLSVRLDQVDDVLKSIVVYDDSGVAGSIRLPGRKPLEDIFRDLPFGPEALLSPVVLLNALTGERVRATGDRRIEGRLVRVVPEHTRIADSDDTITRHRVSVLTGEGIQAFILEQADAVRFTDPALQAQIDAALAAVSAHRTRDRRTLEVVSNGNAPRVVRVGYVVAAPLWKASYRMTLAGPDAATARLQGWAVLENMSGRDWRDVELTLVSGNPVTFRQALYTAYYVDRPEIPVEVLGRVLPAPDSGSIDLGGLRSNERNQEFRAAQARGAAKPKRSAMLQGLAGGRAGMDAPAAAVEAIAPAVTRVMPAAAPPPPPGQARILAAASTEAATSVTFRIPYPVTVASGHSLLAPVIDRAVPATRVSLYQPATHERHPLAAVRLSNDGQTSLPPGVLTLYETQTGGSAFLGDAQLSPLPAGEQRLVSFALDQKVLVDRDAQATQTIARGRIVNSVLELTFAQEERTQYRLKAPAREARTLLVEHPRNAGWTLDEPPVEETDLADNHYRIERALAAGETSKLEVVLSKPVLQRIALLNLGSAQYARYASTGELEPGLRDAFRRMGQLRAVLDRHEQRRGELDTERERIHQEQKRIRDNLSRVPRDSDLQRRYLKKLDQQEDQLERINRQTEEVRIAIGQARDALTAYIERLAL